MYQRTQRRISVYRWRASGTPLGAHRHGHLDLRSDANGGGIPSECVPCRSSCAPTCPLRTPVAEPHPANGAMARIRRHHLSPSWPCARTTAASPRTAQSPRPPPRHAVEHAESRSGPEPMTAVPSYAPRRASGSRVQQASQSGTSAEGLSIGKGQRPGRPHRAHLSVNNCTSASDRSPACASKRGLYRGIRH